MRLYVTAALLLISGNALSQTAAGIDVAAGAALAKASGCYSCHANGEKVVGPAFSEVAVKYKDDKDGAASLAQSIQYGSKGKWGRIAMPANPSLSAADYKMLASWVLTVKP